MRGCRCPTGPTATAGTCFTFPPSMWVANILYEHGHRLIASSVGFLTIILAVWLWLADSRRWLRWMGVAALRRRHCPGRPRRPHRAVLPPGARVDRARRTRRDLLLHHGWRFALFTSPSWIAAAGTAKGALYGRRRDPPPNHHGHDHPHLLADSRWRDDAAYGRGTGDSRLPLMFGHIIPDHWSGPIAIHFAHRLGALVVTARHRRRIRLHPVASSKSPGTDGARCAAARARRCAGDARCADGSLAAQSLDQQLPRQSWARWC